MSATGPRTALVLGGGGARGAYEAGVLAYLREELEPQLGPLKIDIVSGTSVGAINACHVASWIEAPRHQARDLVSRWRSLRLHEVLHFGYSDLARVGRELLGGRMRAAGDQHGGLIDPIGLRRAVLGGIRWRAIAPAIHQGLLHALVVTATHVRTGKSEVFIQRRGGGLPPWTRDPRLIATEARIGPLHALASAAIPLLFPAVRLRGKLYVDGGLRMNVPLSPALRLGAERVAVISLRHFDSPREEFEHEHEHEAALATAPFLIGKTLNALLLDRTDEDLERLERINTMLEAGVAAYGERYPEVFNTALMPHRNMGVRYIRNLLVRPSKDIGRLALEYADSPGFRRHARGMAASTILRLVDRQHGAGEDLISYLLFDGGFADLLIALGRHDARAQEEEWARFWSDAPENETEAVQRQLAVGT